MARRIHRLVLSVLFAVACLPLHAAELSGTVALTSDYVFRGVSQSNGRAAWQAGARIDGKGGAYASAWASRVGFASAPGAAAEIDYVVGIHRALGDDWTGDLNATWFTYAGASELDYLEWIATATWRERRWLALGVSRDVFATGHTGVYAQAGIKVPLHASTRMEFSGGYYRLQRAYGRSYAHAQATLAWQPHPRVELRLSGHLTDHAARVLSGGLAGPRLEASLQASF